MRFLLLKSGITKIVIAILIVVVASAVAVTGYYAATYPASSNAFPSLTPSPVPTVSPTPTSPSTTTPTQSPTATPIPTNSINPTPTPSPSGAATQEKVRDSIMSFIVCNHPETAQFMKDLVWTGGRVTPPNLVGAETYMYYSQGWNITINYPVVPNAIYKITTDYSATSTGIPYRIIWQGTWQNKVINETSYVFAQ